MVDERVTYTNHDVKDLIQLLNKQQSIIDKRERQLRKAISYIISDVCSLSEEKIKEIEKELEEA